MYHCPLQGGLYFDFLAGLFKSC